MTRDVGSVRADVERMMPQVVDDLKKLVALPSVAFPGFDSEPVMAMADATTKLLQDYGVSDARAIEIEDGYPLIYG
ncbi:MAG: dipeptidase, partial [Actinomycetota bacterium]